VYSCLPGLFGAAALAAAGLPVTPGGSVLLITLCHGGVIPISLPQGDGKNGDKSCPGGCHAAMLSRRGECCGDIDDSA